MPLPPRAPQCTGMGAVRAEIRGLVCLTGFGSFPGVAENPTARLCNWLQEQAQQAPCGAQLAVHPELATALCCTVLPVSAKDCDEYFSMQDLKNRTLLAGQNEHIGPVLFVHLGVDSKAQRLKLESCAYNEGTFRVPDVRGWQPQRTCISATEELGARLETPLDVTGIVHELRTLGFDVDVSTDPGRYICNWIYYRSLCCAASLADTPPTPQSQQQRAALPTHHQPSHGSGGSSFPPGPFPLQSSQAASNTAAAGGPIFSGGFMLGGSGPWAGAMHTGQHLGPASSPPSLAMPLHMSAPLQASSRHAAASHTITPAIQVHGFLTSISHSHPLEGGTGSWPPATSLPATQQPSSCITTATSTAPQPALSHPPTSTHGVQPSVQRHMAHPVPATGQVACGWDPSSTGHSGPASSTPAHSSRSCGPRPRVASLFVHVPPFETVPEEVQRAFLVALLKVLVRHFFSGGLPA